MWIWWVGCRMWAPDPAQLAREASIPPGISPE